MPVLNARNRDFLYCIRCHRAFLWFLSTCWKGSHRALPTHKLNFFKFMFSLWRVKSSCIGQSKIIEVLCRRERVKLFTDINLQTIIYFRKVNRNGNLNLLVFKNIRHSFVFHGEHIPLYKAISFLCSCINRCISSLDRSASELSFFSIRAS